MACKRHLNLIHIVNNKIKLKKIFSFILYYVEFSVKYILKLINGLIG